MMEGFKVSKEKFEDVYHKIKLIFTHVFMSCEKKLTRRYGTFELLGCDILFDEKLTPYLLELNANPAIFTGIFKEFLLNKQYLVIFIIFFFF